MTWVLIVDDEPQILRALQINLHAHGYQVIAANDGASALLAAQKHPLDVVVLDLDLGLPDLDGVQVRGATRLDLSAQHCALRPARLRGQGARTGCRGPEACHPG